MFWGKYSTKYIKYGLSVSTISDDIAVQYKYYYIVRDRLPFRFSEVFRVLRLYCVTMVHGRYRLPV